MPATTTRRASQRPAERVIEAVVRLAGVSAIGFVLAISGFLFWEAGQLFVGYTRHGETFSYPLDAFLTGSLWNPLSHQFGVLPLVAGSLVVTAIAMVIAAPLGVATAAYLGEFCPRRLREGLKPAIEMLAAIPSVVIGFFGLVAIGPMLQSGLGVPSKLSALSGGIALAIMALPTIVTIADDALAAVPRSYRNAALALGADRWQTTWRVVVPAALPGILAALILGMGRVVGETMAVLMVTGNAAAMPVVEIAGVPVPDLTAMVATLTGTIAGEMGETHRGSEHYRALFAIGALLFAVSFVINGVASWSLRRARLRMEGRA